MANKISVKITSLCQVCRKAGSCSADKSDVIYCALLELKEDKTVLAESTKPIMEVEEVGKDLYQLASDINDHHWEQQPSGNVAVLMRDVLKEIGKLDAKYKALAERKEAKNGVG